MGASAHYIPDIQMVYNISVPLNATYITVGVFTDYRTVTKEHGLTRLLIRDTTIDRTSR